jgi:hypothetical protein
MGIPRKHKIKALRIGALIITLWVAGCAGIAPYEPRNNREEGPEKGLFTGSAGEFVFFRKADEPETDSEASKRPGETTDGEQPNMGGEEKKAKKKSSEQQP